jgi:hypothetical protein
VQKRVKRKGRWSGGRQPRLHPKPPEPVLDRAVECPVCRHTFVVLIEEPRGAYTTREAAQFLRISIPTLHRLVERGLLRPSRGIRHLSYSQEEMLRYLRDTQL